MSRDLSTEVQKKPDIPHIEIKIEYRGDTITHYGAQFIDAIGFLIHAEESIRQVRNITTPVDVDTEKFQKSNMDKLLELAEKFQKGE